MPAVFSEQARAEIRRRLQQEAAAQLAEKPYSKIKIEDLAKAAGISKGAFYKFYPTKELFFYELLRQLHEQLYSPVLEKFTQGTGDPAADFCGCLLESCRSLQSSGLQRFWLEDSRQILAALPEGQREAQRQGEILIFRRFLARYGPLAVSEEEAMDALRALILTVYDRRQLGDHYESILSWMAQGVCSHIFA